jgi:cytochrome c oxidase cbb3-type subunit 3
MKRLGLFATAVLVALVGCRRETRRPRPPAYLETLAASKMPAPGTPGPYDGVAWGISEGARLYTQMNCSGCHFHGGGGMGPALMDRTWLYGGDDADVFATILLGRPNGMPSFRSKLTDDQAWQLVAYVRSLSGRAPKQAGAARDDHMSATMGPGRASSR